MRHLTDSDRLAIAEQRHIDISLVTDAMLTPSERDWVANNLGIAGQVAKRICACDRSPLDFFEVQSAAYVGLCKAALTYDASRGVNRCTHAWHTCYWVAMASTNEALGRVRKSRMVGHGQRPLMINFADMPWRDVFPYDPVTADPVKSSYADLDYDLDGAIAGLAPRLAQVIRLRMDGKTLETVGKWLHISKERVRQLESKAHAEIRQKLQAAIDTEGGDDHGPDGRSSEGISPGESCDPDHAEGPIAARERRKRRYRKYRRPTSSSR